MDIMDGKSWLLSDTISTNPNFKGYTDKVFKCQEFPEYSIIMHASGDGIHSTWYEAKYCEERLATTGNFYQEKGDMDYLFTTIKEHYNALMA